MLPTISLNDVERKYEEISNRAESEQVKSKLKQIHETLRKLSSSGSNPSISVLVRLMNDKGLSISSRSFYNARLNGNLYRQLYNIWSSYWFTQSKDNINGTNLENNRGKSITLDFADLEKISDSNIRYQIIQMLVEFKKVNRELDILKNEIVNSPSISVFNSPVPITSRDIEAISNFLQRKSDIAFDKNGALVTNNSLGRGTTISSPGLKEALVKVLEIF